MKLLTAVTLLLSFSLAISLWCYEGYETPYGEIPSYSEVNCPDADDTCYQFSYRGDMNRPFGCGRCSGEYEEYCYECYDHYCNYPDSGAGHFPTTLSLLIPAALFLLKIA